MKICFVGASRPHTGGMVNYFNNISRGLYLLGHQTDIVSIFGTEKKIKIRSKLDTFLGKILGGREWLNFLAIQLIKVIIFFRLLKNHLQKKYDFIYVTDVICANAIGPIEKIFKLPVILNPIDSVSSVLASKKMARPGSWFFKYLLKQEKKACLKARALATSGVDIAAFCQETAGQKLVMPVMDNPIDETVFYPNEAAGKQMREKLGLQNKFIVLYIGRLSPEKGIIYLLRAIPEILKKEPDTNIFIAVGGASGPDKENLTNYIKTNHYENYARMLGYVADEDINAVYNMTDIFCAPSVNFEGEATSYLKDKNGQKVKLTISTTTTTLQEAMACGKPVIGTAVIGLKETIKENFNGLLVQEKNSKALAKTILKLKNNPRMRKKMAKNASITAKNRYLPTVVAKSLIDYYKIIFNQ